MIRAVRVLIIMAFAAGACARPAVGGEARNSDSVAVAVRGSGITPCPPTCAWESIFSYSHASLSGPRAPWHEALLSIVHSFGGREAAVLEVIQSSRFNEWEDRKSTRLNSSHVKISYAVFCLKKKTKKKK